MKQLTVFCKFVSRSESLCDHDGNESEFRVKTCLDKASEVSTQLAIRRRRRSS